MLTPIILFDDDFLLVLDKPSGWITNMADTTTDQPVVEKWLKDNYNFEIFQNPQLRHGIVHRIDKETSGCLLVAKDEDTFFELQRQFKERLVHKKYLALCHGELKTSKGEISEAVGRLPWRRDRFGVMAGGREATTFYKVLQKYQNEEIYSLIEAFPKTGRTHQIRIHLKHIGNPIVSDTFYAGRKTARRDRKWCPRLFLHSSYIEFLHPKTKSTLRIDSVLPPDLEASLAQLSVVR